MAPLKPLVLCIGNTWASGDFLSVPLPFPLPLHSEHFNAVDFVLFTSGTFLQPRAWCRAQYTQQVSYMCSELGKREQFGGMGSAWPG